ncbi:hypothetical protein ACF0H5_006128 [Mactra antiquata]
MFHQSLSTRNMKLGMYHFSYIRIQRFERFSWKINCSQLQATHVSRRICLRGSSNWSFSKLYEKWFGDKKMKEKLKVIKEAESLRKELIDEKLTKINIGDLMRGCLTSKHLLDIIYPYIENNTLMLSNGVYAIEYLQSLVYKEILASYPHIPYGNVKIIYDNLLLMKETDTAFATLHKHPSFNALKDFLARNIENMNNKQFVSSFNCLMFLNVSMYDLTLRPFFIRLAHSGNEGFDLSDILKLFNISTCLPHPSFMLVKHVNTKLIHYLLTNCDYMLDRNSFQALITLSQTGLKYLNVDKLLIVYNMLYETCAKTDVLEDLESTLNLIGVLQRNFFSRSSSDINRTVYYQLYEEHKRNIISEMYELCSERVESSYMELQPHHLGVLSGSLKGYSSLRDVAVKQSLFLLNNNIHELSTPEICWLVGVLHSDSLNYLSTETKQVIKDCLNSLDFVNFCLVLDRMMFTVLERFKLYDAVWKKAEEFLDQIFDNRRSSKAFSKFLFRGTVKYPYSRFQSVPSDLKLSLQSKLVDTYHNTYIGLLQQFHVDFIQYLHVIEPLTPSTLKVLAQIVDSKSLFENVSNEKLFGILSYILSKNLRFNISQESATSFNEEKMCIYNQMVFSVLYKSFTAYCQNMSVKIPSSIDLAQFIVVLGSHNILDDLLARKMFEHLINVDIYDTIDKFWLILFTKLPSLLPESDILKERVTDIIVSDILQNFNEIEVNLFALNSRLSCLMNWNFKVLPGTKVEKILKDVVKRTRDTDVALRARLLSSCSKLNVDVRKEISSYFRAEHKVLQEKDSLKSGRKIMEYDVLRLIQLTLFTYPDIQIPAIQFCYGDDKYRHIENVRAGPMDLHTAIEHIAGDKQCIISYPVLHLVVRVWKAMVFDMDNKPVKFIKCNLINADRFNLKKKAFFYVRATDRKFWLYDEQLELLRKKGWEIVTIHEREWYSIGLAENKDKLAFLREKVFGEQPLSANSHICTVNTDTISEQWKDMYEMSQEQYSMRQSRGYND